MDIITSQTDGRLEAHYRILDVRRIPNVEQNLRILQAFEALHRGGAFVLLAGTDPHDMCEQMRSEIQERCEWRLLEQSENAWRVLIRRID